MRESACTGVHGASRLTSNSLLEGLVFGHRIAATIISRLGEPAPPPSTPPDATTSGLLDESRRPALQALMSCDVGVLRDEKGLAGAVQELAELADFGGDVPGTEAWETTNLLTVAAAMTAAALRRERRGARIGEMTTPAATTPSGAGTSTRPSTGTARCTPIEEAA